jgi:hypothetical protein
MWQERPSLYEKKGWKHWDWPNLAEGWGTELYLLNPSMHSHTYIVHQREGSLWQSKRKRRGISNKHPRRYPKSSASGFVCTAADISRGCRVHGAFLVWVFLHMYVITVFPMRTDCLKKCIQGIFYLLNSRKVVYNYRKVGYYFPGVEKTLSSSQLPVIHSLRQQIFTEIVQCGVY